MSDYKNLLVKQRENPENRDKVNQWLRENIHEDVDSLQAIVLDDEAQYIPEPVVGWHADEDAFQEQLDKERGVIYGKLLSHLNSEDPAKEAPVEDVEDPELEPMPEPQPQPQPKPKAKKAQVKKAGSKDVADAIVTLLNTTNGGITEDRVKEIVREELSSALSQLVIEVAK
jgi:hypothetical protein